MPLDIGKSKTPATSIIIPATSKITTSRAMSALSNSPCFVM